MSDDDFDAEKTQIFLSGGIKPQAPDESKDREGIQLKARAEENPTITGATEVDFDITSGEGFGTNRTTSTTRTDTADHQHAQPVAQPAQGPTRRGMVLVLIVMALGFAAFLLLR